MRYLIGFIFSIMISYVSASQVVYVTDDIDKATYVCYLTENQHAADFIIYESDWRRDCISNYGRWFYTDVPSETRFWIYWTNDPCAGGTRNRHVYITKDKWNVLFKQPSKRRLKKKQQSCL